MQGCVGAPENTQLEQRQKTLYQMLIEYNDPRDKGGILKLRGATRGGTIDDQGRERKELRTRSARGHARFADPSPADTAENVGAAAGEDSKGTKISFSRPSSSDSDVSSGSRASSADTAEHTGVASDEGRDLDVESFEERLRDLDEESFEEGLVRRVFGELHHFGDSSEWVIQVNTHTHNLSLTHTRLPRSLAPSLPPSPLPPSHLTLHLVPSYLSRFAPSDPDLPPNITPLFMTVSEEPPHAPSTHAYTSRSRWGKGGREEGRVCVCVCTTTRARLTKLAN
jgi:hypothetical protein